MCANICFVPSSLPGAEKRRDTAFGKDQQSLALQHKEIRDMPVLTAVLHLSLSIITFGALIYASERIRKHNYR